MNRLTVIWAMMLSVELSAADDGLRDQATASLRQAVAFLRTEVAVQGTYLWHYSEDLAKREGEGVATATQGWVQPPGTPAFGLAFLSAWEATGDSYYLEAARETAYGLIRGQLRSGGWTYSIDFSSEGRRKAAYREGGGRNGRNVTTLDDDTTQSALRFLTRADHALQFKDSTIRESVDYALQSLLEAQYPNGAWPQGYAEPPNPDQFPVRKASLPETWSRTWPGSGQYWLRYTLNDNSLKTTVETLLEAGRIYREAAAGVKFNELAAQCRAAAEKAGDFLLLAQLPEPQPGWAQQYDFDMHPAWARKFEPPAVTGGESRGVLRTLLTLYRETGERRFLEPIPRALEYYRSLRLPNGRLARFYELSSNKPLYFTREYVLTYDDGDMPTHYAFQVADWTASLARVYERAARLSVSELNSASSDRAPQMTPELVERVKAIIDMQDDRGRWIEGGGMRFHRPKDPSVRVINSSTWLEHLEALCLYLTATAP